MQSSQLQNVGLQSTGNEETPAWARDPTVAPLVFFSPRSRKIRATKQFVSELAQWRKSEMVTLRRLKGVQRRIMMFLQTEASYLDNRILLECDLEEEIIALLALYMDFELRILTLSKKEQEQLKSEGKDPQNKLIQDAQYFPKYEQWLINRCSRWLYTLLPAHDRRLDALLSTTVYSRKTRAVLDPLFRKVLWETPKGPLNSVSYVRHMIAYKIWRERALVAEDESSKALNNYVRLHLHPKDFKSFPRPLLRCLGRGGTPEKHARPHNINLKDACLHFKQCKDFPDTISDAINYESLEIFKPKGYEVDELMDMITQRKKKRTTVCTAVIDLTADEVIDLTMDDDSMEVPLSNQCVVNPVNRTPDHRTQIPFALQPIHREPLQNFNRIVTNIHCQSASPLLRRNGLNKSFALSAGPEIVRSPECEIMALPEEIESSLSSISEVLENTTISQATTDDSIQLRPMASKQIDNNYINPTSPEIVSYLPLTSEVFEETAGSRDDNLQEETIRLVTSENTGNISRNLPQETVSSLSMTSEVLEAMASPGNDYLQEETIRLVTSENTGNISTNLPQETVSSLSMTSEVLEAMASPGNDYLQEETIRLVTSENTGNISTNLPQETVSSLSMTSEVLEAMASRGNDYLQEETIRQMTSENTGNISTNLPQETVSSLSMTSEVLEATASPGNDYLQEETIRLVTSENTGNISTNLPQETVSSLSMTSEVLDEITNTVDNHLQEETIQQKASEQMDTVCKNLSQETVSSLSMTSEVLEEITNTVDNHLQEETIQQKASEQMDTVCKNLSQETVSSLPTTTEMLQEMITTDSLPDDLHKQQMNNTCSNLFHQETVSSTLSMISELLEETRDDFKVNYLDKETAQPITREEEESVSSLSMMAEVLEATASPGNDYLQEETIGQRASEQMDINTNLLPQETVSSSSTTSEMLQEMITTDNLPDDLHKQQMNNTCSNLFLQETVSSSLAMVSEVLEETTDYSKVNYLDTEITRPLTPEEEESVSSLPMIAEVLEGTASPGDDYLQEETVSTSPITCVILEETRMSVDDINDVHLEEETIQVIESPEMDNCTMLHETETILPMLSEELEEIIVPEVTTQKVNTTLQEDGTAGQSLPDKISTKIIATPEPEVSTEDMNSTNDHLDEELTPSINSFIDFQGIDSTCADLNLSELNLPVDNEVFIETTVPEISSEVVCTFEEIDSLQEASINESHTMANTCPSENDASHFSETNLPMDSEVLQEATVSEIFAEEVCNLEDVTSLHEAPHFLETNLLIDNEVLQETTLPEISAELKDSLQESSVNDCEVLIETAVSEISAEDVFIFEDVKDLETASINEPQAMDNICIPDNKVLYLSETNLPMDSEVLQEDTVPEMVAEEIFILEDVNSLQEVSNNESQPMGDTCASENNAQYSETNLPMDNEVLKETAQSEISTEVEDVNSIQESSINDSQTIEITCVPENNASHLLETNLLVDGEVLQEETVPEVFAEEIVILEDDNSLQEYSNNEPQTIANICESETPHLSVTNLLMDSEVLKESIVFKAITEDSKDDQLHQESIRQMSGSIEPQEMVNTSADLSQKTVSEMFREKVNCEYNDSIQDTDEEDLEVEESISQDNCKIATTISFEQEQDLQEIVQRFEHLVYNEPLEIISQELIEETAVAMDEPKIVEASHEPLESSELSKNLEDEKINLVNVKKELEKRMEKEITKNRGKNSKRQLRDPKQIITTMQKKSQKRLMTKLKAPQERVATFSELKITAPMKEENSTSMSPKIQLLRAVELVPLSAEVNFENAPRVSVPNHEEDKLVDEKMKLGIDAKIKGKRKNGLNNNFVANGSEEIVSKHVKSVAKRNRGRPPRIPKSNLKGPAMVEDILAEKATPASVTVQTRAPGKVKAVKTQTSGAKPPRRRKQDLKDTLNWDAKELFICCSKLSANEINHTKGKQISKPKDLSAERKMGNNRKKRGRPVKNKKPTELVTDDSDDEMPLSLRAQKQDSAVELVAESQKHISREVQNCRLNLYRRAKWVAQFAVSDQMNDSSQSSSPARDALEVNSGQSKSPETIVNNIEQVLLPVSSVEEPILQSTDPLALETSFNPKSNNNAKSPTKQKSIRRKFRRKRNNLPNGAKKNVLQKISNEAKQSLSILNQEKQPPLILDQEEQPPLILDQEKQQSLISDQEKQSPLILDQEEQPPLILDQEKQQSLILDEEKQQSLILDEEKQPSLILDQEKQQSLISDQEKQSPLILDQEEQPPLILDQEKQQSLILDEEKQQSLILDDEKQPSLILDQEKQSLISDQEKQSPLILDQEEQAPLILDQEEQPPLISDQEEQPPLISDQEKQSPLILDQEKQQFLILDEEKQPPLILDQEERVPLILDQEKQSPLSLDQEEQAPLILDQEEQPPLISDQEKQSPLILDQEKQSPLILDQEEQPPLISDQEKQSPLILDQEKQPPLILDQEKQQFLILDEEKQPPLILDQEERVPLILDQEKQSPLSLDQEEQPPLILDQEKQLSLISDQEKQQSLILNETSDVLKIAESYLIDETMEPEDVLTTKAAGGKEVIQSSLKDCAKDSPINKLQIDKTVDNLLEISPIDTTCPLDLSFGAKKGETISATGEEPEKHRETCLKAIETLDTLAESLDVYNTVTSDISLDDIKTAEQEIESSCLNNLNVGEISHMNLDLYSEQQIPYTQSISVTSHEDSKLFEATCTSMNSSSDVATHSQTNVDDFVEPGNQIQDTRNNILQQKSTMVFKVIGETMISLRPYLDQQQDENIEFTVIEPQIDVPEPQNEIIISIPENQDVDDDNLDVLHKKSDLLIPDDISTIILGYLDTDIVEKNEPEPLSLEACDDGEGPVSLVSEHPAEHIPLTPPNSNDINYVNDFGNFHMLVNTAAELKKPALNQAISELQQLLSYPDSPPTENSSLDPAASPSVEKKAQPKERKASEKNKASYLPRIALVKKNALSRKTTTNPPRSCVRRTQFTPVATGTKNKKAVDNATKKELDYASTTIATASSLEKQSGQKIIDELDQTTLPPFEHKKRRAQFTKVATGTKNTIADNETKKCLKYEGFNKSPQKVQEGQAVSQASFECALDEPDKPALDTSENKSEQRSSEIVFDKLLAQHKNSTTENQSEQMKKVEEPQGQSEIVFDKLLEEHKKSTTGEQQSQQTNKVEPQQSEIIFDKLLEEHKKTLINATTIDKKQSEQTKKAEKHEKSSKFATTIDKKQFEQTKKTEEQPQRAAETEFDKLLKEHQQSLITATTIDKKPLEQTKKVNDQPELSSEVVFDKLLEEHKKSLEKIEVAQTDNPELIDNAGQMEDQDIDNSMQGMGHDWLIGEYIETVEESTDNDENNRVEENLLAYERDSGSSESCCVVELDVPDEETQEAMRVSIDISTIDWSKVDWSRVDLSKIDWSKIDPQMKTLIIQEDSRKRKMPSDDEDSSSKIQKIDQHNQLSSTSQVEQEEFLFLGDSPSDTEFLYTEIYTEVGDVLYYDTLELFKQHNSQKTEQLFDQDHRQKAEVQVIKTVEEDSVSGDNEEPHNIQNDYRFADREVEYSEFSADEMTLVDMNHLQPQKNGNTNKDIKSLSNETDEIDQTFELCPAVQPREMLNQEELFPPMKPQEENFVGDELIQTQKKSKDNLQEDLFPAMQPREEVPIVDEIIQITDKNGTLMKDPNKLQEELFPAIQSRKEESVVDELIPQGSVNAFQKQKKSKKVQDLFPPMQTREAEKNQNYIAGEMFPRGANTTQTQKKSKRVQWARSVADKNRVPIEDPNKLQDLFPPMQTREVEKNQNCGVDELFPRGANTIQTQKNSKKVSWGRFVSDENQHQKEEQRDRELAAGNLFPVHSQPVGTAANKRQRNLNFETHASVSKRPKITPEHNKYTYGDKMDKKIIPISKIVFVEEKKHVYPQILDKDHLDELLINYSSASYSDSDAVSSSSNEDCRGQDNTVDHLDKNERLRDLIYRQNHRTQFF